MRPADVWEYDYKGSAPGGNMYNCMLKISKNLDEQARKIDELTKKVSVLQAEVKKIKVGGIDTAEVSKAVLDDAASRLRK